MKGPVLIKDRNEEEYKRLEQLSRDLRIPTFGAFVEIKVTQPGKKEPLFWQKQRSHSWTRNAYNVFVAQAMGIRVTGGYSDGNMSIKTTGASDIGGNQSVTLCGVYINSSYSDDPETSTNSGYLSDSADASHGIVCGVGVGVESFDGHALINKCGHGTGVNQLAYNLMPAPIKSWDAGTRTYTALWARFLNNNSPGIITVTETGLIAKVFSKTSQYNILMSHDILGASVAVPASGQIYITYSLSIVFP